MKTEVMQMPARGSYLMLSHAPFLSEVGAGWTLLFTMAVVKH